MKKPSFLPGSNQFVSTPTPRASSETAFALERFLGHHGGKDMPSTTASKIREAYKTFLADVHGICNDSVLHSNPATTLYNICTRKQTAATAYREAVRYFGNIERLKFDEALRHATNLQTLSNNAKGGPDTLFNLDFDFASPESKFDEVAAVLGPPILLESSGSATIPKVYHWLQEQTKKHEQSHGGALSADNLCGQILEICKAGTNLEIALFELIGESNIELISEIIQRADALKAVDPEYEKNHPSLEGSNISATQPAIKKITDWEGLSANQKKKQMIREQKEMNEAIEASMQQSQDWLERLGFSSEYLEQERALGLQKNQRRGIDTWKDNLAPDGTRVYYENRGLPAGTTRKHGNGFEEVFIPAAPKPPPPAEGELVPIESLEAWAQPAFAETKFLNRIQSKVLPCAFYSNENMLVCAPTGAGKTNIAMLSLLQLIRQYVQPDGSIDKTGFKAIYIAPMKALAQEVVGKFSEKLGPLGLVVKEYTGDMQLSKQEIAEAQLLVCTPEKYDVSTRKGGDGSLGTLVSLIIIDEVHLLADERGAVIEMIVARTQRYVETSQRMVRIVGLSATLPNYQDVGNFLRVNPTSGLFFFGSEFRPIPLDQTFIGITEKQRIKRNDMMTKQAYEKMIEAFEKGKQVMIFVHSRKDTSRTMQAIWDLCAERGTTELLANYSHEKFGLWKRQVDKSRSQEVQQLFERGMGVHHAGMLRPDRTLVEQLFEAGLIKVLCCTATLAWGVNLPAHTVIIKGTEMYDPERGGFVDLSILDVLQIFGRAGRPQFDTTGHAILITPHDSLAGYLAKLSQQAPIESTLIKSLPDHMNAEIVNGTINNMKEAVAWLTYTFLFIRMKRNGLVYGIRHEEAFSDPQLEKKRYELVKESAEKLDSCMMARYDRRSGNLGVTDLGRIASHYYIKHTTIESFNRMLAPHLSDNDAVHVLCSSTEFDSLKVRPEEMTEIDKLQKSAFMRVKVASDDVASKVNVLLQGYLNRARIESFTLQSDTNYVAQNAGRITRALFEICLRKGWSGMSRYYLNLCKSIDRRVRLDHSPLRQFDDVPPECAQWLEKAKATHQHLLDMSAAEIGQLIHNQKLGPRVKDLVTKLPMLNVDTKVKPITKGILRLSLTITMAFDWVDRYHGFAEPFWLWVEDSDNEFIYHSEYIVLQRKDRHEPKTLDVTIPVRDPLPAQYYIRVLSDVWVGCETVTPVSFQHLLMPAMMSNVHTDLLNLHPIPITALKNPDYESLYSNRFSHFNPIQSQMFHVLYHTNRNVLVGAPTGSGKTITAELAILRQHRHNPKAKTVYVAPLRALARERLLDWQKRLSSAPLNLRIVELTGEHTPDMSELWRADILIVTPEKWDSISRGWQRRGYVQSVGLVIIDEIHLLGVERGPVLEILVSRMRFISSQTGLPIRFVGLSTALANARDLGDWLGIDEKSGGALYNFRPSVRPVPMRITIQGFPGKHYCPRMATMNKPAYAAILEHSPSKPVLIFVSSRRQTRLTALDLIALCAADDHSSTETGIVDYGLIGNANPKRFLGKNISEEEISDIASTLKDSALRDTIVFGVGIHHAGLDNHDRAVVESLFLEQKIQVLVCTSTLACMSSDLLLCYYYSI
jgi:activating signal cointegrator complex subunit 3